jgi:hypothetical protein
LSVWPKKHDVALRRYVAQGLTDYAIARLLGHGAAHWRILKRRQQLGLAKRASRARRPMEVPRPAPAAKPGHTLRPCLKCSNPFNSEGPHNRLCGNCRNETDTVFTRPAAVIR